MDFIFRKGVMDLCYSNTNRNLKSMLTLFRLEEIHVGHPTISDG